MVKFGERLKAARTAKHMSQQALADVIGKSLNTVGLYERGLRQPSLETLCLLADTLEVSDVYKRQPFFLTPTRTANPTATNTASTRQALRHPFMLIPPSSSEFHAYQTAAFPSTHTRGGCSSRPFRRAKAFPSGDNAVSYTHLDVYTRQLP